MAGKRQKPDSTGFREDQGRDRLFKQCILEGRLEDRGGRAEGRVGDMRSGGRFFFFSHCDGRDLSMFRCNRKTQRGLEGREMLIEECSVRIWDGKEGDHGTDHSMGWSACLSHSG